LRRLPESEKHSTPGPRTTGRFDIKKIGLISGGQSAGSEIASRILVDIHYPYGLVRISTQKFSTRYFECIHHQAYKINKKICWEKIGGTTILRYSRGRPACGGALARWNRRFYDSTGESTTHKKSHSFLVE